MAAWKIFYSYSHKDEEIRNRLATYLAPLRQQNKIMEWHDRKIEPGSKWDSEISDQLNSADLILLLVTGDFLASDYCFGVEVERALDRLKRGEVKVIPILAKPCLWQESRFSEIQIIPRDAKPMTSWASSDDAYVDVANEIRKLVSEPPPMHAPSVSRPIEVHAAQSPLSLVRGQILCYARLYERTRQRMPSSNERTARMGQIFKQMRSLATASYPLLGELAASPSPGERLAAVSILQVFATEGFLPFLVELVESEKPYVGYQAIVALRFAVDALDPRFHTQLGEAIRQAKIASDGPTVGLDTYSKTLLREAEKELQEKIEALMAPDQRFSAG